MNDSIKARAGIIYNVVEAVILAFAVALTAWTADTVIAQGQSLATVHAQITSANGRLDAIESRGSRTLESHIVSDDVRVGDLKLRMDKVEAAILALQATPGQLDAIRQQLANLKEGQIRIEHVLDTPNHK